MPNPKDTLARKYLDLEKRRAAGEFTYGKTDPAPGADGVSAEERNNWNVTEADMDEIEAALRDGTPFTDKSLETEESDLDQINDAVRRMQNGDISKYNHLPQFLREYYGRKALKEAFGSDTELPPLNEETKKKLDTMTVRPDFRNAVSRLIERNAVDKNGAGITDLLKSYDVYLNEKMLQDTLQPVSGDDAERIRKKYPGDKGEKMLADNAERQCFMAKSLFMTQLGRMDIVDEDGSRHPYHGSTAELFSHGSRVALTLPYGEKDKQDRIYDSWRRNALDSGVMFKGRFASHEMNRRKVTENGYVEDYFQETRIKWKDQLKKGQLHKKVTTYVGNYGMNIPLGGMGRQFNKTDSVDDQGGFGHMFIRTRKGDLQHCGSILMGFENAQPKKESAIGQLHNFKALSHDMSSFYSSKVTIGKAIGGREADLSHMLPEDLSEALDQFELGYRTLQERAKQDPEAAKQLTEINRKLCGDKLPSPALANMLTSMGMKKDNAIRCVESARTPKDANYSPQGTHYRKDMYALDASDVMDRDPNMPLKADTAPKKQAEDDPTFKDGDRYQAYIDSHLRAAGPGNRKDPASDLSRVIAAHYLKDLKKEFKLSTIDNMSAFIRRNYALDSLGPDELAKALQSENAARNKGIEMRDKLYRCPEGYEFTYTRTMTKLLRNMVDPKGHSEAYQKLYNNVKKAAELNDSLHWKNPEKRAAAIMQANMQIMDAVDEYTAGKEKLRKTLKGTNTFDSALDAAACVQRFIPGAGVRTDAMIDRINSRRDPQDRINKSTFMKEYGGGVDRKSIRTWDELKRVRNSLTEPEKEAQRPSMGL